MKRTLAMTGLAVVLAACGAADSASEDTLTTATTVPPTELEVLEPPVSTIAPNEVPADFIEQLMADAVERTGLPEADMTVSLAEAITWSDGSLGCPEPGVLYTQALVDGYRVVITTPDGDLDYRSGGTDFFVVCDQ